MNKIVADTVYYDGACPLCQREISWFKRQAGGEKIQWIDVSCLNTETILPGLSRSDALKRFYVRLSDGSIVSGSKAFISVWKVINRLKPFGRILDQNIILFVLEKFYNGFLRIRPFCQYMYKLIENKTNR